MLHRILSREDPQRRVVLPRPQVVGACVVLPLAGESVWLCERAGRGARLPPRVEPLVGHDRARCVRDLLDAADERALVVVVPAARRVQRRYPSWTVCIATLGVAGRAVELGDHLRDGAGDVSQTRRVEPAESVVAIRMPAPR